jgi:phage-related protein
MEENMKYTLTHDGKNNNNKEVSETLSQRSSRRIKMTKNPHTWKQLFQLSMSIIIIQKLIM